MVEDAALVDAPRRSAREQLQPLDVLARRRRVRRLGEDEDLALRRRLELGEPSRDRARLAEHLDEVERIDVVAAGLVRRRQALGRLRSEPLRVGQVAPPLLEQAPDRLRRSDRGIPQRSSGTNRREAARDESLEHVVDPLARKTGEPRELGARRHAAAGQREVGARLVAGQPEARERVRKSVHS